MDNKNLAAQDEFDRRLEKLTKEFTHRIGVISVASTMVVHTAKHCAQLGPEFMPQAIDMINKTVEEFRTVIAEEEAKAKPANEA